MGKKFAPNYANIFMAKWEREALRKCPKKPLMYLRFLDDIFMIWTHSEEEFWEFFDSLNKHHESITLKATLDQNQIDFLDVTVFKGPRFRTENILDSKVFCKPTDTHQLLHKKSFHPKHTFSGILKSQFLRYNRICNNEVDFEQACSTLLHALRERGYSKRFLRRVKSNTMKEIQDQLDTGPRCQGETAICRNARCRTCIQLDPIKEFKSFSNNKTFKIRQNMDCASKNVIYLITCAKCGMQYVGQTCRELRSRFTGHRSDVRIKKSTPVADHFGQEDHTFQDCHISPIEQLRLRPDFKANQAALIKREEHWMDQLETRHPQGINKKTSNTTGDIIPLVIPYSSTAVQISKSVKKHYAELQSQFPEELTAKPITAYTRNKNLSDELVCSKLK